ncbi:cytochrome oxidase assembly protein [Kocuria tytonicola]|uniref:COX15/CtaA family protein n=1 Tax=Kocuria tytonicola TaxID=2055946 RepID=UPI000EF931D9|nr:COX15/CtaA family protein [Kocuria tytonicola]RLZ03876.1 cytochrome oxidase assembly protein [Kocuria tytonicola]
MSDTAPRLATDSFWWPRTVTPWVRGLAIASLLANTLLVFTGGLVRLTGSGLGCPTWPRCTADSWTNTSEMGIHGVIEFGNRLLTFVLTVVAVLTFLSVLRLRHSHPKLFRLALYLLIGIPVQAVVGGVLVHLDLHPLLVGMHYFLSAIMISLSTLLVLNTRREGLSVVAHDQRPGQLHGQEKLVRALAVVTGLISAVILYLGTLVTGTGPHAGDQDSARLAFDSVDIARAHAVPVYLLTFTVVAGMVLCTVKSLPRVLRTAYAVMALVIVAQGAVGYYQYLHQVPVPAVSLHMVLSAALIWAATRVVSISFYLAADSHEHAAPVDLGGAARAPLGDVQPVR